MQVTGSYLRRSRVLDQTLERLKEEEKHTNTANQFHSQVDYYFAVQEGRHALVMVYSL